ncbi:MAG: hypothetical protein H6Q70_2173 [Firmicutes bacterium]|nr:hypothetical protein [Bacillota bacterium]
MKMNYNTKINKQCGLLIKNLKAKAIDFIIYYFVFLLSRRVFLMNPKTNYGIMAILLVLTFVTAIAPK